MPEGHTIHRLATALDQAFAGATPSVSSPQGRFAGGAALLDGQVLERAEAFGKHLVVTFGGERLLNVHLGLIGKFGVQAYAGAAPPAVGAVRLRILDKSHVADLRGPNVCAVRTPEEVEAIIARLGPDPLRADADPDRGWTRLSRSRRTVAELLMDQTVVAGLGNIYRSELLHRHRVNPLREGRQVKATTWTAIWEDAVRLLHVGVITGRIVTEEEQVRRVEATAAATGTALVEHPSYAVYKRTGQACPRCGSRVRTQLVAGRNLYWCGGCQRRS